MTPRRYLTTALAVLCIAAGAAAQNNGIHIPAGGRTIGGQWRVTDGAGFVWDISSQGQVDDGTGDCYDGGMRLQIGGQEFQPSGQGRLNKAGNEIELGPWRRGSLTVSRRVYIDKKLGYARWIDIFENKSDKDRTVSLRYYSNMGSSTRQVFTSGGRTTPKSTDWAAVTDDSSQSRPAVAHIFASPKAKYRPRFQASMRNDSIYIHASFKVPARKAVAICIFQAQRRPMSKAKAFMKTFQADKSLRTLPLALRRIILNFHTPSIFGDIELRRRESTDTVVLDNNDPLYGTIVNPTFVLSETFFGPTTLEAKNVTGMVLETEGKAGKDKDAKTNTGRVRMVLADGQIVSGKLTGHIRLRLAAGGTLKIPYERISQWSYRISAERPERDGPPVPCVLLDSGDRLVLDAAKLDVKFKTGYGVIPIRPADVLHVQKTKTDGQHRLMLMNGSTLLGSLEPETLSLALKLGAAPRVPSKKIASLAFAAEGGSGAGLTCVVLKNNDKLHGRITDSKLAGKTEYGSVDLQTLNIQSLTFGKDPKGRTMVVLLGGTTLRCTFATKTLGFELAPGMTVKLPLDRILTITRSNALPPKGIVKRVEELIAMLGSDSYQKREKAMKGLVRIGDPAVPVLQRHADHKDPEVRQRIGQVLEKLGAEATGTTPTAAPGRAGMAGGVMILKD